MLTATAGSGLISFALGLPAPEFFPTAEFASAAERALAGDRRTLQYGPQFEPFKKQIVELMQWRGVDCSREQVFLTAGAQQGMSLLAHLLLEPESKVITEELIYTGFQQILEPFRPEILTVPTDLETGMDVDAVAKLLLSGARPAFIYVITEGHNPVSVSMHPAKRARLVELAERYGVPIIEDDAYGFLCYEKMQPPLRALSERWVFYVGSFSKILAPALRAGWVVAPERLILPLSVAKESADIDTSTFAQRIISEYLDTGQLSSHISTLRSQYQLRRDTMLRALEEHFPDEANWRKPESGVFFWIGLSGEVDIDEVFRTAIESEKVAFIPGYVFSAGPGKNQTPSMRLNFSHPAPAQIAEGIPRLARVLKGSKLG
jgi:2-aminoadipate transaminase